MGINPLRNKQCVYAHMYVKAVNKKSFVYKDKETTQYNRCYYIACVGVTQEEWDVAFKLPKDQEPIKQEEIVNSLAEVFSSAILMH